MENVVNYAGFQLKNPKLLNRQFHSGDMFCDTQAFHKKVNVLVFLFIIIEKILMSKII